MTNVEALKKLAMVLCGVSETEITGITIAEVITYIAANCSVPAVPTAPGTYNIVVDEEGTVTWTLVTT